MAGGVIDRREARILKGVRRRLPPGEQPLVAIVARPRGVMFPAGGPGVLDAAALRGRDRRAVNAAARAGLSLAVPGALVLTDQRLLTVRLSPVGAFGLGGRVKEVLSAVPIEDVAGVDVEQVSWRLNIILRVRGQSIALLAYPTPSGGALASTLRSLKG